MIDRLVDAGAPVDRCCKVLGITRQNYYKHKRQPTAATQLRRQWLTGLIREIHVASRGTYGYRRVHAELTLGMGITGCPRTVSVLMTLAGIYGPPGPVRVKRLRGVATADDLVNRKFHRLAPNELWVTDITQHRTREGGLLLRGRGRVQPQDRGLVDGFEGGRHACGQCVGHGHPQPPAHFRRHRSR
ncbi:hypothetical protein NJB18091_29470 [Mycobacterium marinum]|nr:hypothetical protein NJB18091_29470 [Mycobacterium marinum]GJO18805.1 hypothetical protein NJB1507_11090 [Mycobacterium marinum]